MPASGLICALACCAGGWQSGVSGRQGRDPDVLGSPRGDVRPTPPLFCPSSFLFLPPFLPLSCRSPTNYSGLFFSPQCLAPPLSLSLQLLWPTTELHPLYNHSLHTALAVARVNEGHFSSLRSPWRTSASGPPSTPLSPLAASSPLRTGPSTPRCSSGKSCVGVRGHSGASSACCVA